MSASEDEKSMAHCSRKSMMQPFRHGERVLKHNLATYLLKGSRRVTELSLSNQSRHHIFDIHFQRRSDARNMIFSEYRGYEFQPKVSITLNPKLLSE